MVNTYSDPLDPLEGHGSAEQTLSPRDIVTAVYRRWWVVLAVLGLVLALGVWRTTRQPFLYESTVSVRVQAAQSMLPGMQVGPSRMDYRIDPLVAEQALIKSLQVAERAVRKLGLQVGVASSGNLERETVLGSFVPVVGDSTPRGDYEMHLGEQSFSLSYSGRRLGGRPYGDTIQVPGGTLISVPKRPEIRDTSIVLNIAPTTTAAFALSTMVSVHAIPSTDLIQISFTGPDRLLVAPTANAVAAAYSEFSAEGARNAAVNKTDFIAQSLRDQGAALQDAQDQLRRFKEAHKTADVADEAKALFANIESYDRERRDIETEQKIYASLFGRVEAADTVDDELRKLAGTDVVGKNVAVAGKYAQWQELQKELQGLQLSGLGPSNDDVRRVEAAISDTKRDLKAASAEYLQGLATKLQSVNATIAEMKAQTQQFLPLQAEQARLVANVQTAQSTYSELKSQYQLARIAQSAEGGMVRIIDPALVPTYAVSPNRKRAFAIALAFGILLGVGLAVLLERLDDSVRTPTEVSDRLGVPVMGMIPAIQATDLPGAPSAPGINRIVTHADPHSPVAEAYRSLRTNLAFARSQQGIRSLVLTSPGPSDGKSTTVANLAITFAQQGQRTLLVDADLRRAVLDKSFGVPRSPGLTDVIVGEKSVTQASHATQVPNLFVMGSGQLPPNPSELLGSAAMRNIVRDAAEQFDIVLFDSPPLLAVTDAAVISTIVDGTLLIVRMASTQRKAVARAVAQLRAVHARLLGSVLNDISATAGSYYGGYGYYYYYSYRPEGTGGNGRLGMLGRLRRLSGTR